MKKITFTDFLISRGHIGFNFEEEGGDEQDSSGRIYFELSPKIRPDNNLVAMAISTLCGNKYNEIVINLPVGKSTASSIRDFTKSDVKTLDGKELKKKKSKNLVLNFSGGFDSLAAKCLMPSKTRLVSMDFGGKFSREELFFKKFKPYTVKTNLVDTPLRKNSWSFMGIASLLFSEYLNTEYHAFGNILEASPGNFSEGQFKSREFAAYFAVGIRNAPYVLGLTEVGTLLVVAHYMPEYVNDSLASLANPGEEKRYRKQVLAMIASKRLGKKIEIMELDPPKKPHFKFGQYFASDFLSFYIIKYAGIEVASHTISGIPDEVVEVANNLKLEFYERLNTNLIVNFPQHLLGGLLKNISEAGILPYTEDDWREYTEVKRVLSKYYDIF
ncbi:hypothetical protein [Paenibacillus illinoisensis]|uniref:hypothetical protein n=1 Tax=Paenibacillus illinoisensis TaxID=59845 RepID=UPI000FD78007|nr:hypothetical protein [Paenibacillus illinoisensis]